MKLKMAKFLTRCIYLYQSTGHNLFQILLQFTPRKSFLLLNGLIPLVLVWVVLWKNSYEPEKHHLQSQMIRHIEANFDQFSSEASGRGMEANVSQFVVPCTKLYLRFAARRNDFPACVIVCCCAPHGAELFKK